MTVGLLVLAAGCDGGEDADAPAPGIEDAENAATDDEAGPGDDDAPAGDVEAAGNRCTAPPGNARMPVYDEEADEWEERDVDIPHDLVEVVLTHDGDDLTIVFEHAEEIDWGSVQDLGWGLWTYDDDDVLGPSVHLFYSSGSLRVGTLSAEWHANPDPMAPAEDVAHRSSQGGSELRVTLSMAEIGFAVPFTWRAQSQMMVEAPDGRFNSAFSPCPDGEDRRPRFTG